MKKILSFVLMLSFSMAVISYQAYSGTKKEQLKQFVTEAATFAKQNGKAVAIRAFMNKQGQFRKGELYIFAYDFKGVVVAHGTDPNLVGNNFFGLKDRNGKLLIQEMIKIVKSSGEGWVEYQWFHPDTRKYMTKIGFVKKVDDTWFVGSGIYK